MNMYCKSVTIALGMLYNPITHKEHFILYIATVYTPVQICSTCTMNRIQDSGVVWMYWPHNQITMVQVHLGT